MAVSRIVPPHAVDRPELLARLDVGLDAPLTLVVAPAGSGKTVLLTQWTATMGGDRIAWLDMSSADDDAVHFARRLVRELGALDASLADLDAPMGTAGRGLGEALIEFLAAALAEVPGKVVVIFDDLHRVSNTEVVTDLWRLVDLLPPNAHFVFSSRVDLKLGWSRHRLQHGLVELRQAELAFDPESAGHVLERILRRPVDPAATAVIVERTEGWAAGIQLTALSLRFRPDADGLVEALAESDRLAIDYLSEEVLDAQPAKRRRALLQLSVLEEINPGLVEVVGGIDEGALFLRELEDESMFVVAVAGKPDHYRFHHLFRDLLRYRLRAADSEAESELLSAAAGWHSARGDTTQAIECLLAAKRWGRAIDLILGRGRDVFERGETATVARWLSLVPNEVRSARAEAELLYGILEGMSGRASLAEEILRGVLADQALPIGPQAVARAYLAACVQFRPHPELYLKEGQRALALIEDADSAAIPDILRMSDRPLIAALSLASIGRAHFYLGDPELSIEWLERSLTSEGGTYGPYRIHVLGSLALAEAWQGRLIRRPSCRMRRSSSRASWRCWHIRLPPTHTSPARSWRSSAVKPRQARSLCTKAMSGRYRTAGRSCCGSHMPRRGSSTRTERMPPRSLPPAHRRRSCAWPCARSRTGGSVTRAVTPRPAVTSDGRPWSSKTSRGFPRCTTSVPPARGSSPRSANDPLEQRRRSSSTSCSPGSLTRTGGRPNHAGCWSRHWRSPSSRDSCIRSSRPARVSRAFFAHSRVSPPDSGGSCWTASRPLPVPTPVSSTEPLTARELELLAYLPSRLTNAELAARCFVSVNTVKTHMAHIYRKLDAGGRDAAIARARELGLLDTADIARVG